MSFLLGDMVWVISDFGVSTTVYHGEIVGQNQFDEISVSIFPDQAPKEFYIHQHNLTFTKSKHDARLIHIAKLCKSMDFSYDMPEVLRLITDNTGIINDEVIKKEIEMSQSQFPELWI